MAEAIDAAAFRELMERLADAWQRQDTDAALDCFTADAVYLEPPDAQLFVGHDQLRPYFATLEAGTIMRWHHLSFDETTQAGAGEFTFGDDGAPVADHGVCIVEVRDGRISRWREYLRKGPMEMDDFLGVEGKVWQWHIGMYP